MSAAHHDHHVSETKPVSFTVPFILALVFLAIMFTVLSMCDPGSHHQASGAGHEMNAGHGQSHGEAAGKDAHGDAETVRGDRHE